jgi:hypothetical protein
LLGHAGRIGTRDAMLREIAQQAEPAADMGRGGRKWEANMNA